LASIQVAVIAAVSVIGLAAVALATALLIRADRDWREGLRSRRGLGLLSLFAAGCLLAVGGQFLLSRLLLGRLAGPTARSDGRTRFQMALMDPIDALVLRVHGSDPFRDRSEACSLRLTAVTRSGKKLISEVPRCKMSLPWGVGAKIPRVPAGDIREYIFGWQSVIEGAAGEEARALASRVAQLNDWRRFDHVEAEVVARTAKRVPMPESLLLTSLSDLPVELFHGYRDSQRATLQGDGWVSTYTEPGPAPLANRLGWIADESSIDPRRGLNPTVMGLVAAGVALLAFGAGLLVPRRDPDREGGRRIWWPTRPKAAPGPPGPSAGSRTAEAYVPDGTEPIDTPSRAQAKAASAFVWTVWALMILASLAFVGKYSHNIPFLEDWWNLVPSVTGQEPVTLGSLWAQDSEHRYPLSRAVGLAIFKLGRRDFRAPTVFRTVILGVLALAMILVARGLRGRARFSDAFFPLLLLQMGFQIPLVRGWGHVAYLVPTIVASPMLVIAARRGTRLTPGIAMLAGLCLALLPLCSAAGLLYLPILSLWLGYSAVLAWRWKGPRGKRTSLVLLAWIIAAFYIVLRYFRGYDWTRAGQYSPPSPSIWDTFKTTLAVMTAGFGEAGMRAWPVSGLGMLALTLLSVGTLGIVAWRDKRGPDRSRALGLLFFLGASGMLALGLGWGRAGMGYTFGFLYSLLTIPMLCGIYLAWGLDRRGQVGRLAQAGLFVLILISLVINIPTRLRGGREEHAQGEAFEQDLRRGMPPYMLLARNGKRMGYGVIDWASGSESLRMMHRAGIGSFRHMQDDPDFRAVPLPLKPIEIRGIEWEEGMAHGANGESYLTYALPKPMSVAAIRLQCSTPQPGAVSFSVAWRRKGDPNFPEPQYVGGTVWPTRPLTFAVAETIDQVRIYPDKSPSGYRPFNFYLSKFEVLVPEGRGADVGGAMGDRVTSPGVQAEALRR
jgi:hypothetical protein